VANTDAILARRLLRLARGGPVVERLDMRIMAPFTIALFATPAAANEAQIEATGIVALPQADADDTTETSLGLGAGVVYRVHPNVAVTGSFDYVFANAKDDVVPDDYRIYFYSLNLGVRVITRERVGLQPFGELSLGRHTAGYDGPDDGDSQSDIGFRIGGGVTHRTGAVAFVGKLRYSSAEIENADIEGFLIDLGIAWDL
jgi:opacity protein-like surface antigen